MNDPFDKGEIRGKLHATDWLADPVYAGADNGVVQVQFKNTRNGFYRCPPELTLSRGDIVAVEASPGHDIGRVLMTGPLVVLQMKKAGISKDAELKKVFRIARQADIEKFEEAKAREHSTMIRSRQIAAELGLDMKIGDVEYQGDGGKAIFYYIADERVDFRKLIRILADAFKVRIEMRQIGARQEAGRIGGIGPCGRPLCCSSWMGKFVSVGTGAARLQDLSMNPQKLAGQCAKLKCCLNFETDTYAESLKKLPPKEAVLETIDGSYYYFKPDILARKVTYSTDKNIPANLVTIDAERAFEIIEMNKQGIKPDTLLEEEDVEETKEYIDLTDQDSLTRFDKSKKRKRKKSKGDKQKADAPREETKPGKKLEKKQDQKPDQKPERKKNDQKRDQRPHDDRRQEPKADKKQDNRPEQKPERRQEGNNSQKRPHRQRQRNNRGGQQHQNRQSKEQKPE